MQKIPFEDLPSTNTPINATNLNAIQNNVEGAFKNVLTTSTTDGYCCTYINSIVESGSNANGNWVKYIDGTMICYMEATGSVNINTAWGSVYYKDITTEYTFPQTFISVPSVQLTVSPTSTTAFWQGYGDEVPTITTTSYKNFALIRPTSTTGVGYKVKIFAIGKWK